MFADESERRIVPSTRMEVFQLRMRLSHPAIRLIELRHNCKFQHWKICDTIARTGATRVEIYHDSNSFLVKWKPAIPPTYIDIGESDISAIYHIISICCNIIIQASALRVVISHDSNSFSSVLKPAIPPTYVRC